MPNERASCDSKMVEGEEGFVVLGDELVLIERQGSEPQDVFN